VQGRDVLVLTAPQRNLFGPRRCQTVALITVV
jgi:hypothetical protein